ncbi:helix-turn-helix domain-containing protein [Hymenobacter cellulosivorans]|uniref:Helix-turn-helix domain-containing protein n=1 Tax=Hymenobacter cellulosivorans TaxID=2932249 RepID=A0ABY4FCU1_9BACT|nr:helix-turn-helix domain-containing protein [Hymenobacter cellulosivorans]UOQ54472.1 helix-turn-helix domain-containing protein [Hymenobacter cellulosivorans]
MPDSSLPAAAPDVNLVATVRHHFGFSVRQLASYLGVSAGFITHMETGRKGMPASLLPRLTVLSRLLPPPLGQGPPAAPEPPESAIYDTLAPLPAPDPLLQDTELPGATTPAAEPLRQHLRDVRQKLLQYGQRLAQQQSRAVLLARRRRGVAQLQTAPFPTEPAETARYARWLGELATDLARDEPDPTQAAADRLLLAARVAALRAEVALLAEINSLG